TEALLLEWSCTPSKMRHLGLWHEEKQSDAEAPAREIVLRGFNAVPGLIALLDDRRITVHETPAFMRAPARIPRLGEFGGHLLQEIAGMQSSSLWRQAHDSPALRTWWEQTRGRREEDFFAEAIFKREGKRITWVNEGPARILALKFPEKLPSLCQEFSKHA